MPTVAEEIHLSISYRNILFWLRLIPLKNRHARTIMAPVAIVHGINGTAPYTYVWSNGDTGPMADSLSAGTHLVTITDSNGCVGHRFINLVNDSIPIVQYFMTKPMCGDSSGSIALTVTNGHPGYHFSWSNGDTTSTANNLHAGLYTVTVSDIIGCQTSSIFVVSDTLTTVTQDTVIANTTCNTANGILQVTGLQGLPPYTYQWLPGGQTTSLVSNLAAGTYICITKDANNCAKIDTLVVNPSLGLENIVTKANANCDSSNGKIYLNGVLHHTGPYQILWSTGATSSSIVGLSPGVYWVKATDSIGCTKTDTITLLNDGIPHLKLISYTAPQCFGDSNGSVTLGGQGGGPPYKYSLDGTNFSSVAQMNNISGGTFTIYITDANACPNDTIVFFPQPPEIIISYQADTVICFNDQTASIQFAVSGGYPPYLLSWNGNSFTNQFAFSNQTQGIYPVIIKDSNNCTISKNVIIPGPQQPLEIVTEIKDIPCFETNNGSIHITLQGGWQPYTYSWSNGAQGLVLDSLGVTNAQFTVTDSIGCVVQKNITIEQLLCCKAVLPNAFSPNGDTKNDVLHILPISEVSTVKWIIYNRWGQVVFSTKNITDAWDGNYNGAKCDLGVYYYLLEYTCPFQKEKMILKGDITLVR
jgi:gliding motility-associated-like protein